jgi:putative molybdopterin biosynthesis protein
VPTTDPRLLHPLADTAKALGIGRTKLYEEIKAGRLATVTIGSRRLVPDAELNRYVDARVAEAAA